MTLVGVEHVGLDAERPQRPHAADAQHDLLAQAVVLVAAVEAVGDVDAVGAVAVDVGVEQVQRDATDVGPPDVGPHGLAGEVDGDLDAGVGQAERAGREVGDALLLPAVGVEALAEVALGVEQADGDERHAEVRRRLEVVTGEHAEAAGVLRERLADAELGGEVGHGAQRRRRPGVEPAGRRQGGTQATADGVDVVEQARVGGQLGQPLGARAAQHLDGVGVAGPPTRPQAGEQPRRLGVPAPVEVGGQLGQPRQLVGDGGLDVEAAHRSHRPGERSDGDRPSLGERPRARQAQPNRLRPVRPAPGAAQSRSKRSRFMTLSHAATKSRTNRSPPSALP